MFFIEIKIIQSFAHHIFIYRTRIFKDILFTLLILDILQRYPNLSLRIVKLSLKT